jgi:hypothetical protein
MSLFSLFFIIGPGDSKKLLNIDKLGKTPLIALAGLRQASMKGKDIEQISKLSSERGSNFTATLKKKNLSMANLEDSFGALPKGGAVIIPFIEAGGCMGGRKVVPIRIWHSVDDEGIRRHAGPNSDSTVVMNIPLANIHDVKETTNDRDLMHLANNAGNNGGGR